MSLDTIVVDGQPLPRFRRLTTKRLRSRRLWQPGPMREGRRLTDPLMTGVEHIPDERILDEKPTTRS